MRTSPNWKRLAQESFQDADKEILEKYLEWLRDSLKETSATVRRSVTSLLLLVVVFGLLLSGSGDEASLGLLKITNASMLLAFIPPVIAYFYAQILIHSQHHYEILRTHQGAFSKWHGVGYKNDLESRILPIEPLYWNLVGGTVSQANTRIADRVEGLITIALMGVIALGVLAFQIGAYIVLFSTESQSGLIVFGSLAVTVIVTVGALTHFVLSNFTVELA